MVLLPPPKSRVTIENPNSEHYSELNRGNDQVTTRARSALPASVRPPPPPKQSPPTSPSSDVRKASTSSNIEPDLVAKDRYDPASKCFSYVPVKALNEHFTMPRKPTTSVQKNSAMSVLNISPSPSEIAAMPIKCTDLQRRPETPKWEDDIAKISEAYSFNYGRNEMNNSINSNDFKRSNGLILSSTPTGQSDSNKIDPVASEEKAIVIDQAKRVTKRRKTKYGSYKTLNDDAYTSDMDDLCDPDFYLSYTPQSIAKQEWKGGNKVEGSNSHHCSSLLINGANSSNDRDMKANISSTNNSVEKINGSRSVELPRRITTSQLGRVSLDDYFPTSRPTTSIGDNERNRDAFRMRNCRSAASAPHYRDTRLNLLFGNDRYDSLHDAENADDWLSNQLSKLRAKRDNNPEAMKRRKQEKMLLEELKHVNSGQQVTRERDERNYSFEGYGKCNDSVSEEGRLHNVRLSPSNGTTENGVSHDSVNQKNIRRVVPSKTADVVRHKPPTPPPRARSRSPPSSPYPRRTRTRISNHQETAYQRERNKINCRNEDPDISDLDDSEFGHLKNILMEGSRNATGASSSNSMKSILKKREVQNDVSSPSTVTYPCRSSSPVEDWSIALSSTNHRVSTPAFPVRKETPLPHHPLLFNGANDGIPSLQASNSTNIRSSSPRSIYFTQSRRTSSTSIETGEVINHHPLFVKDTSKYWYKPKISREEAINMLRDKQPGTFVVRDSSSFSGSFGLALKVATPPPGVHSGDGTELVRHFLIESSSKGVKLKGCNNEPIFGTLSALVYQHSVTPLALPIKLLLPEYDPAATPEHISAAQALLQQGAACNVTYITSLDTETLTGQEAVRRCIDEMFQLQLQKILQPVSVHFKVSAQGITVTDNTRRLFFRRHYSTHSVTYVGIDALNRVWDNSYLEGTMSNYVKNGRIFAFVGRKIGSRTDNSCHIFAELEPEQPATAVVNFIDKVMMGNR